VTIGVDKGGPARGVQDIRHTERADLELFEGADRSEPGFYCPLNVCVGIVLPFVGSTMPLSRSSDVATGRSLGRI